MESYQFQFSKQSQKDIAELTSQQKTKLQQILTEILSKNPYLGKSLKGNLAGLRSYRLNLKDRILYEVFESKKTVLIIRAKSHYGD
jgi:toxin YoeB